MVPTRISKDVIGQAEQVDFPELGLLRVPARIDTGAKTSSLWASNIREENSILYFELFGPASSFYNGKTISTSEYDRRRVASSNGIAEERYVVKFKIVIAGRKIRASFSLANREQQVYPVLIGRKVLSGKFLVDVSQGTPLLAEEKRRSELLQQDISEEL